MLSIATHGNEYRTWLHINGINEGRHMLTKYSDADEATDKATHIPTSNDNISGLTL
jgi:hypothetical protein